MNYSRLIIGLAVVIFAISLLANLLAAIREPDNDGRLKDSYGTRFYGLRAAYETLVKLGLPVERSLTPPARAAGRATAQLAASGKRPTLVMISPSPSMLTMEPEYQRNLRTWVEQGGRLVLAQGRRADPGMTFGVEKSEKLFLTDLLGLEGLRSGVREKKEAKPANDSGRTPKARKYHKKQLTLADRWNGRIAAEEAVPAEGEEGRSEDAPGAPAKAETRESSGKEKTDGKDASGTKRHKLKANLYTDEVEGIDLAERMYGTVVDFTPHLGGEFAAYGRGVKTIALPEEPEVILDFGKSKPVGKLELEREGKVLPVGAVFRQGKGEIVFLSDAALFFNRFFARADNSVFCVNVLAGEGDAQGGLQPAGRIVFDEFFHGLNIQGNAWWLLTRMPYGLIALALLAATGLWAWRGARRLGPAVPLAEVNRRSLREYVEAMAALFQRAQMRRHVFEAAYLGALWHIRRELNLDPRSQTPEALVRALERKQPERAGRLMEACGRAQLLLQQRKINRRDAVRVIKEIGRCL